jgi:hypothetical protein
LLSWFEREADYFLRQVFEDTKRFGLLMRNFRKSSNDIHTQAKDSGRQVITQSMRLGGGRTPV